MFISLKWKAVTFLSIVLIFIGSVWVGQNTYIAFNNFSDKHAKDHLQHEKILNQLLEDNFLKLSQFSQLLAAETEIDSYYNTSKPQNLNVFLDAKWVSLNIDMQLDYISVWDAKGNTLAEIANDQFFKTTSDLNEQLKTLNTPLSLLIPQSFIYCKTGCMQVVKEPFVFANGEEGVMIVGQNMSGIVYRYFQITNSNLAILTPIQNDHPEHENRDLTGWKKHIWALSNFQQQQDLLEKFSANRNWPDSDEDYFFDYQNKKHRLRILQTNKTNMLGNKPDFIDFNDETKEYQELINNIWSAVLAGVFVLIIFEGLLIFLMLGPIQRLINVAKSINLLPDHEYEKAREILYTKKTKLTDELTLLEENTASVSNELETLYTDIQTKNEKLNDQVLQLSRSRSFLARLIDNADLFIITQNLTFHILSSNTKFTHELEDKQQSFLDFFSDDNAKEEFIQKTRRLESGVNEIYQHEMEILSSQNRSMTISWTHTPVEDEEGNEIILSIGLDLTLRKQNEDALKWLANNDPLTKIGNRRAFQQDLKHLLYSGGKGAIVFIDVNKFKQINDLFGHLTGDKVLIEIAHILKEHTRSNDFISRLAGDEFTLLLPRINYQNLEIMLEKLAEALRGSVTSDDGRQVSFSASLGAAMFPEHGNDEQTLVIHADMAMYQAKNKSDHHWSIFNPEDNNLMALKQDHELAAIIRKALKENDLFFLTYQPIITIETGEISHYEVLLRLQEGDKTIYPGDFIPATERMGLIRNIDEWVIRNALISLQEENLKGELKTLAINISAPSLQSTNLPELFCHYLSVYEISPSQIIIELTETAYIENFSQVLANLEALTNCGIKIALDDFGVGFSSFSYLKKMPLSYVKLDGSYISDLLHHPDHQVFVESLSKIIQAFGMQPIAEFVEDEETLQQLKALGVTYGQGYFIGKPLPYMATEQ